MGISIPPVQVTSITAEPTGLEPLVPSVKLIQPLLQPENTVRASRVDEMYSTFISRNVDVLYEVGRSLNPSISFVEAILLIRNNTANTELSIILQLPEYIETTSTLEFVLNPNSTASITLAANLDKCKELAVALTQLFRSDELRIIVRPQNLTGPVFVRRDLPQLTT